MSTIPVISQDRERQAQPCGCVLLTPWTVQNILYETIKLSFLTTDPKSMGYSFRQRINPEDCNVPQINLQLGFDLDPAKADKLPQIFVKRGQVTHSAPTIGQAVGFDLQEATQERMYLVFQPMTVDIITSNSVAEVEQVQDFVRHHFLDFETQIRRDFRFTKFRLNGMSQPMPYRGAKDTFLVQLQFEAVFQHNATIHRDSLKLKTFSVALFDALTQEPLG